MTALACAGYGSVFLAVGLLYRNPIIPAAIVLVWESANVFVPPGLKTLSVIYYRSGGAEERVILENQTYESPLLPGFVLPLARLLAAADQRAQ